VRVREVADPKCRCAGVSRPRWIRVTPRGALPDPPRCPRLGSCRRRACAGNSPWVSRRIWVVAAVWIMWFIRRFPARESGAGRSRRRMPRSVRCRQRLELLLDRDQLGSESTSDLAGHVAWAHRRQDGLGLAGRDVLLALSWNEFGQQSVQPVRGLDPALAQLVTPIAQHPQRLQLRVVGEHPKATGAPRPRRRHARRARRSCGCARCRARGRGPTASPARPRRAHHRPAAVAPVAVRHRCRLPPPTPGPGNWSRAFA
jgi:hypothetical protein